MAVLDKTTLQANIAALPNPITRTTLLTVLDDMVDSYEDLIAEYTTAQRDALTPFEGQKIYNTTSNRLEYYSASAWTPMSQKEVVAVDCSGNPNYPEGLVGDQYIVSVAGYIGGGSGKAVYVGDIVYCIVANAGGTEAGVGTSWAVCHSQSATDNPTFYVEVSLSVAEILALGVTGKILLNAPGAGKVILPISFVINLIYGTTPYATNTNFGIKQASGLVNTLFSISGTVNHTAVIAGEIDPVYANESFVAKVDIGNPTAGDSTMTFGMYYKIHTL